VARERRPHAVVAPAEAREHLRLDGVRHRRDDGDQCIDVHVLHRQRAEPGALDEQPTEGVDDARSYPVVRNATAGFPTSFWPKTSRMAVSATTA
jgi:hypothetical protein